MGGAPKQVIRAGLMTHGHKVKENVKGKRVKRLSEYMHYVESILEMMQKLEVAGLQTVPLVRITNQNQPE